MSYFLCSKGDLIVVDYDAKVGSEVREGIWSLLGLAEMDTSVDFVPRIELDMSFKILMSLDDPCDLARASCVLRSWHEFGMLTKIEDKASFLWCYYV